MRYDGTEIQNATNNSFDATQNGTYTVVVSNSWGCESSDDIQVTGVGINEIGDYLVSLYPNPASNTVTIQFANTVSPTTISLYDVIEKSVFEKQISNISSTQIDVSAYEKGMYNLQIISKEGKSNYKIIIE